MHLEFVCCTDKKLITAQVGHCTNIVSWKKVGVCCAIQNAKTHRNNQRHVQARMGKLQMNIHLAATDVLWALWHIGGLCKHCLAACFILRQLVPATSC